MPYKVLTTGGALVSSTMPLVVSRWNCTVCQAPSAALAALVTDVAVTSSRTLILLVVESDSVVIALAATVVLRNRMSVTLLLWLSALK